MKKKKSQQRKRRYNEEPNGDFRTKKYNNEKKLMDGLKSRIKGTEVYVNELEDRAIEIIQSE